MWQVWDAGWCGPGGSYSILQHWLHGNAQLAAEASIAVRSHLLQRGGERSKHFPANSCECK